MRGCSWPGRAEAEGEAAGCCHPVPRPVALLSVLVTARRFSCAVLLQGHAAFETWKTLVKKQAAHRCGQCWSAVLV